MSSLLFAWLLTRQPINSKPNNKSTVNPHNNRHKKRKYKTRMRARTKDVLGNTEHISSNDTIEPFTYQPFKALERIET